MPSDLRFADIRRKLELHGWKLKRIRGSHHNFTGPGRPMVVVPVHKGKVKAIYAREADKAIQEWLARRNQEGRS